MPVLDMVIVFALMKFFGVIKFSWWWILLVLRVNSIPFATTFIYMILKIGGLFDETVSWWWLTFCILADIIAFINMVLDYIKTK